MSYSKTDWANLPSQTTGVGATNLNKIEQQLYDSDILNVPSKEIPSNSDLNDYTTPGAYLSANSTISSTLSNIPTSITTAFKLIVENVNGTNRIKQTIITNTATSTTFIRTFSATGSWGSWGRIITTIDPDDTNYFTGPVSTAPNYATGTFYIAKAGKIVNLVLQLTVQAAQGISSSDGNTCVMGSATLSRFRAKAKD